MGISNRKYTWLLWVNTICASIVVILLILPLYSVVIGEGELLLRKGELAINQLPFTAVALRVAPRLMFVVGLIYVAITLFGIYYWSRKRQSQDAPAAGIIYYCGLCVVLLWLCSMIAGYITLWLQDGYVQYVPESNKVKWVSWDSVFPWFPVFMALIILSNPLWVHLVTAVYSWLPFTFTDDAN